MSNYRDDLVDVMVAAAGTHSKLRMLASEQIATGDKIDTHSQDNLQENLALSDKLKDKIKTGLSDDLILQDGVHHQKISREALNESLAIKDSSSRVWRDVLDEGVQVGEDVRQTLKVKHSIKDSLTIYDNNRHTIKDILIERMAVKGSTNYSRASSNTLSDGIYIKDTARSKVRDTITDGLYASTGYQDKHKARQTLVDIIYAQDGLMDSIKNAFGFNETITVGDIIFDKLIAKDILTERAMVAVLDDVIHDTPNMAWTMNTINKAMSQYSPYDVNRLAVIDGVLYGECKDGIYRLDGTDETITGKLITDKLDYGENLIKPSYAYTEYQTDGTMNLTVHATQKGVAQQYTYVLPKERAGEMTNGRFVFGRGLYGRQFAYTLTITAKNAKLHDLNIHFETTTRRL